MSKPVVLLSLPGLRGVDLHSMPKLSSLMKGGDAARLTASFPAVTWPVQANMLTGKLPDEHGVVANGFFWRDRGEVEMWTAGNEAIAAPQIWDLLHQRDPAITSAAWFPMLSKRCGADYVCMPAPVHNPDGSESLWCYTKPGELYGELLNRFEHFPLKHFWGPLANIRSTAWIADSAAYAAEQLRPRFFYIYLPHLDYAAQKSGPDSQQALAALGELDDVIGRLAEGLAAAYREPPLLIAASEYVISPVEHAAFPNRTLREAGLLDVREMEDGEHLNVAQSRAWALVDHQFSHVFVKDRDSATIDRVRNLFRGQAGIARVLAGNERAELHLAHERSGDVVLISATNSWQAYYWWLDDSRAPAFARTVDIHNKPGYDPVELHFDPATRSIPLDAALVRGSHGAPVESDAQRGIILASEPEVLPAEELADVDVCGVVLRRF